MLFGTVYCDVWVSYDFPEWTEGLKFANDPKCFLHKVFKKLKKIASPRSTFMKSNVEKNATVGKH